MAKTDFYCEVCGEPFDSERERNKHMARSHTRKLGEYNPGP